MTEYIKTELSDGVLVLTLQRPDKNALTGSMYNVLSDALDRAETNAAVKVVWFQGDGDSFTAGNDLAEFAAAWCDQEADARSRAHPGHHQGRGRVVQGAAQ